jgi:hypothetical protein
MSRTSCLFAFAFLGIFWLQGCGRQVSEHSVAFTGTVSAPPIVEVRTFEGFIQLVANPTLDKVQGRATVRAQSFVSQERARQLAETVRVEERTVGNVLVVEVVFPSGVEAESLGADIILELPSATVVNASTSNGTISVRELSAARIRTSNGDISLADTTGEAHLTTSNGKVTVTGHSGDLRAETTNGNLVIEGHAGDLNGRTTNAPIYVSGLTTAEKRIDLQTSRALIDLTLHRAFRGKVVAETGGGLVVVEGLRLSRTRDEPGVLEGETNPGGAGVVELYTSQADIIVRKVTGP